MMWGRTPGRSHRPGRRAPLAGLILLATTATACSGSGDDDRALDGDPTGSDAPTTSPAAPGAAEGGTEPGSALESRTIETGSSLERRIHENLSGLDAEVLDGDTVVSLPDTVLFDVDEHELRPDADDVLDDLLEALAFFDDAPVEVTGHTDSTGAADYNQELSERRADAVVSYLTTGGVDRDRVTASGYGESRPVASNASDSGRAQNRRVDIVVEGVDFTDLDT